jgi:hypothetical protein
MREGGRSYLIQQKLEVRRRKYKIRVEHNGNFAIILSKGWSFHHLTNSLDDSRKFT